VEVPARYAAAAGGRAVQLNVSLARLDNPSGVEISRQICRVAYALGMGDAAGAEVADLNRAIAAARSTP
jgi:hypothetical protein